MGTAIPSESVQICASVRSAGEPEHMRTLFSAQENAACNASDGLGNAIAPTYSRRMSMPSMYARMNQTAWDTTQADWTETAKATLMVNENSRVGPKFDGYDDRIREQHDQSARQGSSIAMHECTQAFPTKEDFPRDEEDVLSCA